MRSLRHLAEGLRTRLGRPADAASPSSTDDPAAGLVYVLVDPAEQAKPRTLITMLGEPPHNTREVIASVAAACRQRGEYPVLVMSQLRPDLIATSATPIEFMPSWQHLPIGIAAYERYVGRRWSLMLAKWNFTRQVELDIGVEDFVAAQLERAKQPSELTGRALSA